MSRFIQLHLLTSYPPSNLNRDDLGRPKTAVMGGQSRLRISSQSLKRAWRTSDVFETALDKHIGTRTKVKGVEIYESRIKKGVPKKLAMETARSIAGVFGKLKTLTKKEKDSLKNLPDEEKLAKELLEVEIEQLAHISPEEAQSIESLIESVAETRSTPEKEELALLKKKHTAADIALFGRMLAGSPQHNMKPQPK